MNEMNLSSVVSSNDPSLDVGRVGNLMVELAHYREQSEWLALVNELQGRLAGAIDLPSMVEAFSIWLMPLVEHDLIAYSNPDNERNHMFCSCHGPARRLAMNVAEKVFSRSCEKKSGKSSILCEGFYVEKWGMETDRSKGTLLIVRQGREIKAEETKIIAKGLDILGEPLQRALDYEDLFEQARHDTLTGLANRRVFEDRIGPLLDGARRYGHPLTVASMDLDEFKLINDSFGHAAGDKVLQQVAKVLADLVRTSDLLVRMGGDEFILLLPETDIKAARKLAERVCGAIDEMDVRAPGGGKLGISIGLAQWRPSLSKDEWLQQADEVLYHAKATGRSRVCTV